jgi:hypothetical protein
MANCVKHGILAAEGTCRECGYEYCVDCLVFPFGPKQAPMCISCALAFSGVSATKVARRPVPRLSFAERRRRANRPTLPQVTSTRDRDDGQPIELPAWAR